MQIFFRGQLIIPPPLVHAFEEDSSLAAHLNSLEPLCFTDAGAQAQKVCHHCPKVKAGRQDL